MAKKIDSLKRKAQKHGREEDYGLYRNSLYKIAEYYYKNGNKKYGIAYWMCCCYLDINGPNNTSGTSEGYKDFLREMNMKKELETFYFNPEIGSLAPAIIHTLKEKLEDNSFSLEEYKALFLEEAQSLNEELDMPIKPDDAWKKLNSKLKND